MSAAPHRPQQANTPSGGSEDTKCRAWEPVRAAPVPSARYSATFTFPPGAYDDAFHALDKVIAEVAQAIPGYLGEENWENEATGLICNVYYWDSLAALEALMQHPAHLATKQQQARWLRGYHVVIAQVIQAHGDGGIAHPLRARTPAPV